MMNNPNPAPTFAENYCAKHGIPHEKFARAVFKAALYRRAVFLTGLLEFLKRDYFAADFDLIYGVERLRRLRDFREEAHRFNAHPSNRGWLRRRLCLRVSTHRLKQLIKETLPASTAPAEQDMGTSVPFETTPDSRPDNNLNLAKS